MQKHVCIHMNVRIHLSVGLLPDKDAMVPSRLLWLLGTGDEENGGPGSDVGRSLCALSTTP